MEVKAQCGSCRGTGLYSGMCEPRGTAVVCLNCDGTGCATIKYTPFEGRKRRTDIKTVRCCGPVGGTVSYEEFIAGKLPEEPKRR